MKITFCIPSKNNLRYLKSSIQSIRQNSAYTHDVVVFIDSDNDGTESWLQQQNITYIKNVSTAPLGIAYAYNRCIESANTSVVCLFHADMYMAKGFDTNMEKHLQPGVVVCATRVEPPLHPPGLEKIVRDFGIYPEDFNVDGFNGYVEFVKSDDVNKTTKGIFAPWIAYKSDLIDIGLHDEDFHSYHEDSDIFNRMLLNGMHFIQSRDSLVYHFTCRGGQFQDGVEEITTDRAFHTMKANAAKNYLRKWGSWIKNDEYQHPILSHLYDIGFVIKNCNEQLLQTLEPWCSTIYVDCDYEQYIKTEQLNTKYDLRERIKPYDNEKQNHILIDFDAKYFNQDSFNIIQNLSDIIAESGEVGEFELDCFKISIMDLKTFEKDLIVCNSTY